MTLKRKQVLFSWIFYTIDQRLVVPETHIPGLTIQPVWPGTQRCTYLCFPKLGLKWIPRPLTPSLSFDKFFNRTWSSKSSRLAGQWASGVLLTPPPHCWVLRTWALVSMLTQQTSYWAVPAASSCPLVCCWCLRRPPRLQPTSPFCCHSPPPQ